MKPTKIVWLTVLAAMLIGILGPGTPAHAAPPSQGPIDSKLVAEGKKLFDAAMALDDKGDHKGAIDLYNQALATFRRAGDREGEALSLHNIGVSYSSMGQDELAIGYFMQALPIDRELRDTDLEAATLFGIGQSYRLLQQPLQSISYLQQALTIRRARGDKGELAEVLVTIMVPLIYLSRNDEALAAGQEALELFRGLGRRQDEATTLDRIAAIYQFQDQYARAITFAQQSLDIFLQLGDLAYATDPLEELGQCYGALGQIDKAIEFYNQALTFARQTRVRNQEAITLGMLGDVFVRQDKFDQAIDYYRQALDIEQTLGNRQPLFRAQTLWSLGNVYDLNGKSDQALQVLTEALTIARGSGDRMDEAEALSSIGAAYNHLGQLTKAMDSFQQSLSIHRDIGDIEGQSFALSELGDIYEKQGQVSTAVDYYDQAIAAGEKIRSAANLDELKISFSSRMAYKYERAAALRMRIGQTALAFDLSERARARTFLDEIGRGRMDWTQGVDAQLLQREEDLRLQVGTLERKLVEERAAASSQRDAPAVQSLSDELIAKEKEYTDLLTRIKLSNPEYASLVSADPLTMSQVQALLDGKTTLLSYFVTGDVTLAFVVTRDSFKAVELPVSAKDLETSITDLRRFASLGDPTPAPLEKLYRALIAPVKDNLKTPIVGIIPNGVLHYLPFAALYDGHQFFGDQYLLFSLPSGSALPFIQSKRKGKVESVLAVAEGQPAGLPALRYVDDEVTAISKLYNSAPLTGNAATVSALLSRANNANILHIAAHGQLNVLNPLFSRIVLAPDQSSDGSLRVQDIYNMNLSKADLVVLSACQTQLGAQSEGDDIVGLTRAFIYAGAPSVIASLWSVDDQATSVFMTSFYTHLKQGASKAEALQAAQAETRKKYPNPYYWAAFVLTGDPGGTPSPGLALPSQSTVGLVLMLGGAGGVLCTGIAAVILLFGLVIRRRASHS